MVATAQEQAESPAVRARARRQRDEELLVWPDLVFVEFIAATLFTITLTMLSIAINAPLLDRANPGVTPNPSKAPWYFLNLQELLLHMNPALAGVIVPTVALILIAAIPYVDRGSKGLGVWWYSARGTKIAIFSAIYTTVVTAALIALDKYFPLKSNFSLWLQTADTAPPGQTAGFLSGFTELMAGAFFGGATTTANATALGVLIEAIVGWIIPVICLTVFPVLHVILMKAVFKGIDLTEIILGLFTGFVTLYLVLTFVGTAMRGTNMDLYPPWALPPNLEG